MALLADPAQAYNLEITIARSGVETISSKSQVVIDEPAFVTVQTASDLFEVNASLRTTQGDGQSEALLLEASASRDGEVLVEPTATIVRGKPFQFQSGQPTADMVRISLTPIETER